MIKIWPTLSRLGLFPLGLLLVSAGAAAKRVNCKKPRLHSAELICLEWPKVCVASRVGPKGLGQFRAGKAPTTAVNPAQLMRTPRTFNASRHLWPFCFHSFRARDGLHLYYVQVGLSKDKCVPLDMY
jgi:hypothetical protein